MNSGYYAACTGLKTQTQALELLANNLANLNTSGYRGQEPTFRSLLPGRPALAGSILNVAINDYDVLNGTRLDLTAGNLQATGSPLDLALEGPGFFAVQTKAGAMYTRDGHFQLTPAGQLVTSEGDPVLGEQGPVTIPGGQVAFSEDGTISVNGSVAGRLRLVELAHTTTLQPEGTSYYSAPDSSVRPATASFLRQGMLESSNVNPLAAVVNLISVQRHADMLQRALSAYYSDFNRVAVEDLPRV